MSALEHERRTSALLILGSAAGLLLAAAGLLRPTATPTFDPSDGTAVGAAATVNGQPITASDVDRMVAALAADRENPIARDDHRLVVERLIDQELLIQRGLELGLARSDARLRGELSRIVMDAATRESAELLPSEAELRAFFDENADFFRGPARLNVRRLFVSTSGRDDDDARARAEAARARLLAGESFAIVDRELGDRLPIPLPDVALPPTKLSDYLGASALAVAEGLAVGEVGAPMRVSGGYQLLQLVDRRAGRQLSFETTREEVASEFRRRAADRRLSEYLAELRARADIVYLAAP